MPVTDRSPYRIRRFWGKANVEHMPLRRIIVVVVVGGGVVGGGDRRRRQAAATGGGDRQRRQAAATVLTFCRGRGRVLASIRTRDLVHHETRTVVDRDCYESGPLGGSTDRCYSDFAFSIASCSEACVPFTYPSMVVFLMAIS